MKSKGLLALLFAIFMGFTSLSFAVGAPKVNAKVGLSSDLIYFVMPDRYKDGETSNDKLDGFIPTSTAHFHGGDLKGLTGTCAPGDDGLARIKSLGFTAVWVTPLVVQQPFSEQGAGYHGYWGIDFLNVDPHLGTKVDLMAFSACAKKLNLKLILDVVTNHTGDVIKYDARSAYIPAGQENAKNPAWLNDLSNYHNVGDINHCWGEGDCTKIGDFSTLDDLATEKPVVYQGWGEVYGSWIKQYGFVGFRVDTAKHVDDNFFKNWSPLINTAAKSVGINNFTIFGEVTQNNPADLMTYVRQNKMQTALDFPFQMNVTDFAAGLSSASNLSDFFLNDDYYTGPDSSASNLVTFLGNHDMGRIGFILAAKKEQPAAQLLPRTLLAHALLYLSRGIPAVYYGDEVGMTGTGPGNDQMARQDMFATKFDIWKTESRIGSKPIGDGTSFAVTDANPIAQYLRVLSALRAKNPGLANATMQTRYAKGALFVISKKDGIENREYLVAFNNSTKAQSIAVNTATLKGGWKVLLGATKPQATGAKVKFKVPALSTVVLKANSTIDKLDVKASKITIAQDDMTGFYHVTAGLTSSDLLSVEFFVKSSAGKNWSSAGIDNNSPYGVFLDPKDIVGQQIEVKAIATNSKGKTFALPSSKLTISA